MMQHRTYATQLMGFAGDHCQARASQEKGESKVRRQFSSLFMGES